MKANPLALDMPRRGAPIIERIKWKIVLCSGILDTPCWLWTGSCSNGYGQLSVSKNGKRRMIYVHRWLYEHHVGSIRQGHVLHHKCDTPHCVNPAHLEPMTHRHNIRQCTTRQTHCKHGHPLSGDNLYVTTGGIRGCRECNRKCQRRFRANAHKSKGRNSFKYKRLPKGASVLDRIKAKIVEQEGPLETPCWIWMGSLCGPGYGQIKITEKGRSRRAMVHRWMFEHRFGPPPDGADVHHKCDTTRCVNPGHLEAVSHRENIRETTNKITHCKHGHPLTGPNVRVTSDGRRYCRACNYRRVRNHVKQRDKARKSTLRALER